MIDVVTQGWPSVAKRFNGRIGDVHHGELRCVNNHGGSGALGVGVANVVLEFALKGKVVEPIVGIQLRMQSIGVFKQIVRRLCVEFPKSSS